MAVPAADAWNSKPAPAKRPHAPLQAHSTKGQIPNACCTAVYRLKQRKLAAHTYDKGNNRFNSSALALCLLGCK